MGANLPHLIYNDYNVAADENIRLNLRGARKAYIWVRTTAVNGGPSAGTMDIAVQRKFPREGTAWADVTDKAITQVTEATSFPDEQVIVLDEDDMASSDLRLEVVVAFTGGTTPSFTTCITVEAQWPPSGA